MAEVHRETKARGDNDTLHSRVLRKGLVTTEVQSVTGNDVWRWPIDVRNHEIVRYTLTSNAEDLTSDGRGGRGETNST